MFGILLLNKPEGITSHDAVQHVRRRLGTRRVGHAGTLDPIASGLLVMAIGPATRFLQYLPLEPKEYDCTFLFGQETDTYDSEGTVTAERGVPGDLPRTVNECLGQFTGAFAQLPPLYSAVKKEGKPLYEYARKGLAVEREPRSIFVQTFEPLGFDGPRGEFRIVCSGGTYVRTLAHDLGQAVGCGAHVVELQRTRVGRFDIDDSVEMDEVGPDALIPLRQALEPLPMVHLNTGQVDRVRHGLWVKVAEQPGGKLAVLLDEDDRVVSVARIDGNLLHPECVLPKEAVTSAV